MGAALLAAEPGANDRDHGLRTMMVAPMSPTAQDAFRERFGIEPWTEVFGQTECIPVTITPLSSNARDAAGCGLAAPDLEIELLDLEIELLDESEHPVQDGSTGEICLRPRHGRFAMFDGYWQDAAATLGALRGLWYHTGDYGRRLPSGALAFVDRKKDSLRRRGENVSSIELEAAINAHPDIVESAVHAVPSELAEDDIKACVVLRDGAEVDAERLFAYLKEHLPYYAVPRYVEVIEALPRNAVGRVMKHVLREREFTDATWDFEALGLVVARAERR
jgi:crotonobetaine/carnitine-CoA ligase